MKPGIVNLAGKHLAIITDLHQGGVRLSKHDRPGTPVFITESFGQPIYLEDLMATGITGSVATLGVKLLGVALDHFFPSADPTAISAAVTKLQTDLPAVIDDATALVAACKTKAAATTVIAPAVTVTATA